MTGCVIHRVTQLELRVDDWRWPFARDRRSEIEAHFAATKAEKPQLFNGTILLGRNPAFAGGRFSADFFQADFASFLAWRDWGFPDRGVFNGFGVGALRSFDGAFVLGEMAAHTANAGRLYFPAGTPDLDDVRGAMLDIAGSIGREVEEETGLAPGTYRAASHYDCVVSGALIAMIRLLEVDMSGAALRARIAASIAGQDAAELADVRLVRDTRDVTPAMPAFVRAYIARAAEGA